VIDYRTIRVWEWIAEFAGTRDASLTLDTICSACISLTGMTGAWISRAGQPAFATDQVAGQLADLEFLLDEGPAVDALAEGHPVAVTDLSTVRSRQACPVFTTTALAAGARSVLVVPMRVGAAEIGLFGLYSRTPTVLATSQLTEVDAFAEVALGLMLDDIRHPPADLDRWLSDGWSLHRAEIHQATGMVSVQLGVDVTESLVRLRAHAYAQARPLLEIACEVVTRRLRFSPDTSKERHQGP
jgi:hypothetical protein